MDDILLEVDNLRTCFFNEDGVLPAVDGLSFKLSRSEILAVVGESGCGKSVTGRSLINLVPAKGKIVSGCIMLNGENILEKDSEQIRKIRGSEISMIFQEPTASLNPMYKIGRQITETIYYHRGLKGKEAKFRALELLNLVGIPEPIAIMECYPHQLSGGMCQRVMIAIALSLDPAILIADEPTTSLDVTIQAQILRLMKDIRDKTGMSIILITHDMGVVAQCADNVMVMYAGQAVEYANVMDIFKNPCHPYTIGLLKSMPSLDSTSEKLYSIPGIVPAAHEYPAGCRFSPRCEYAREQCRVHSPELTEYLPEHYSRCFKQAEGSLHI